MNKGFTLLELLIVIAILAILASAAAVVLNPGEILRKGRDSSRVTDLNSIRTAINYYIANTSSPVLGSNSSVGCTDQTTGYTYTHIANAGVFIGGTTSSASTTRTVAGAGWIPVALSSLTGGSPLVAWPVDPSGATATSASRYYAYLCNNANATFTVFADMESSTYARGGSGDVESTDGGNIATVYEMGTAFLAASTTANFYSSE
jgi:prepilin-type N-terminal cleavage/methylation domain-containing protein